MRFAIRVTILSVILTAIFIRVEAQEQIVQNVITKLTNSKSFSYTAVITRKDFFSDNLFHITTSACFSKQTAAAYGIPYYMINSKTVGNNFTGAEKYIYNGKELVILDLKHNTYRTKNDPSDYFQGTLLNLLNNADKDIKDGNYRIIQLRDTTIKKIACYHIMIVPPITKTTDSRRDLAISKNDNTLIYYRNTGSGTAEKGGMSLGIIKIFEEEYFSGYKFNSKIPSITVMGVPAGFKPEEKPKPLLAKGVVAPGWRLSSTGGGQLSLEKLKGKVVLIDFTADGCAACILAIPALNNLYEKYKGSDVAIISVNIDGTKKSVSDLIKRQHIKYPVYINGKAASNLYHVEAIPNFYIINKQGIISEDHEGFFENFEQQITSEIEALRSEKAMFYGYVFRSLLKSFACLQI